MTEEQMQAECFQWHWNTYPSERGMLYHNDNNSFNRIEGNKKKALGVVKGVPDYTLILCGTVVFLEFKTETGILRPEQVTFSEMVKERGHHFWVIRSTKQFKELIITFYAALGIS